MAFELLQIRTGHNIGRKTATGVFVEGTEEAIRKEFKAVFGTLSGPEGEKIRKRAKKIQLQIKEDVKSGASYRQMMELGRLGDDVK